MSLMQKCLLFPMVGLNSEIFAFITDNFTALLSLLIILPLKFVAELMDNLELHTSDYQR